MAVAMATHFSDDGKYFALLSTDGKLKIWNTISNAFEQEYTPDFHLTTPCTCLHFVQNETRNKGVSPKKKKKRRESESLSGENLVLGTTSGLLLLYSISKADVDFKIESGTSESISCLTSLNSDTVYSGSDQSIIEWSLSNKTVISKWKAGKEKLSAILIVPNSNTLLTASKSIQLWDLKTKEVLKKFTGHSSDIIFLYYVSPKNNSDAYFISGSKGDRLLSCWNLNTSLDEKNAVANFLMEDIIQNVSIIVSSNGSTQMAACVRSGVVHVYQHTLNGKCDKPLKPKTTIQVVSDTGQSKEVVTPLRIVGAHYRDDDTLCIGHGTEILLTFENVTVSTYKKIQCLLREDPRKLKASKEAETTKTRTPVVNNDAHYLTSQTATAAAPSKRKIDGQVEVPMEKRLENLTLNKADSSSKVPKANNVAQLLVQGLHSKDKTILREALSKRDESVIKSTVKRLPMAVIVPLVEELSSFVQGKTLSCQIGSLWLRNLMQVHASILLSNPELPQLLGDALAGIENRIALQTPLNRLKGRLDLLVSQFSPGSDENPENEEPLLVFNDKDSSDSEDEVLEMDNHSESDNEWDEDSVNGEMEEEEKNEEENDEENGKESNENSDNSNSGEEMSTDE